MLSPCTLETIMAMQTWVRAKLRSAVDSFFCSSSPEIQRVGDVDSGWYMKTTPPPVVVYCAGVGQGISFELELAKRATRHILVFDPSPTGVNTMSTCDRTNLTFYPIGFAAQTGTIRFSVPKDAGEGSFSIPQDGVDTISFECWDLATIMQKHGDTSIDLLKMDIEGFEYDIIDGFLAAGIPVRQLCVEFHPWLKPGRTWPCIRKLYTAGYRIVHKHRGDHTFVMQDNRFNAMLGN